MTSNSPGTSSEPAGGTRVFSGENADHKEYRRWKLWVSDKLRTLDKLQKENYGSYIFTCLSGKALECVEHLEPSQYQCEGGDEVLWNLLDKRFPEKREDGSAGRDPWRSVLAEGQGRRSLEDMGVSRHRALRAL